MTVEQMINGLSRDRLIDEPMKRMLYTALPSNWAVSEELGKLIRGMLEEQRRAHNLTHMRHTFVLQIVAAISASKMLADRS
jgi:hypothetical protein